MENKLKNLSNLIKTPPTAADSDILIWKKATTIAGMDDSGFKSLLAIFQSYKADECRNM